VRATQVQQAPEQGVHELESALNYPMFVKPANMGSSVGISKVKQRADLVSALLFAARYDRRIIVEQGVTAREIEVSVIGNEQLEASLPGEIIPANEWYDYNAKYLNDATQIVVPARLTDAQIFTVQQLALQAFQAVDGAGLARVDFLFDQENDVFYLSEINTMPGFTPMSMYAKMWQASGVAYPELVARLVSLAIERGSRAKG
jgi:D-alanine-D-alanine ligase